MQGPLGLIYVDCHLLTSLPFHLITSKHFVNCKLQTFSFYVATCGYLTCSSAAWCQEEQLCKCSYSKMSYQQWSMWCYIFSTLSSNSRYGQCLQSLAGVQGLRKVQDEVLLIRQNCRFLLPLNYKGFIMQIHVTLQSLPVQVQGEGT